MKSIKDAAKQAFSKRDYPCAFEALWEIGPADFVAFAQREEKKEKPNWFTHGDSATYFWGDFIMSDSVFFTLFESDLADQLLHIYFSKWKTQVTDLEEKLAEEFPDLFIKAVRTNQVFLQEGRIESLVDLKLNANCQVHKKVWSKLFNLEQTLWQEVQHELSAISELSMSQILSYCVIWIETNRFHDNTSIKLNHLVKVYSFFIELVLSEYPDKKQDITDYASFYNQFTEIFLLTHKEKKSIKEDPTGKLLTECSQWISFKEGVLNSYCFDLSIEPGEQNGIVFLNSKPEAHYKWIVNGVRYELNELLYYLDGVGFVEFLEESGKMTFPGDRASDVDLNRLYKSWNIATLSLLYNIKRETFYLNNTPIEAHKLLEPLQSFSINKLDRYENRLNEFSKTSAHWHDAITELTLREGKTPLFIMSIKEYEELNSEVLERSNKQLTKDVINLFSYNLSKKSTFNRFAIQYNVSQKPFCKFDKYLFCPMVFVANNRWFYSFAQAALTNRKQPLRSETESMEKELAGKFKEKGWKVKVLTDQEANDLQGDVDIFIEDEYTQLFVQLKRTYFRLDLKDSYFETINSDLKAAKQLNQAEEFLNTWDEIFKIKTKPVKWIVSTSFENVSEKIDGCRKINFFELLRALETPSSLSLADFVVYIESDNSLSDIIFEKVSGDVNEILSEVIEPLSTIFKPKQNRQVFLFENEQETEEYYSLFNEGVRLEEAGKTIESFYIFQQCISLNPKDGAAFGELAKVLAEMNLFEKSIIAFNIALKILPNDPYISKYFILTLIKCGNYYDGLQLALHLYEKYPLLVYFRITYQKYFGLCLNKGLLHIDEIEKLQSKWNSLN